MAAVIGKVTNHSKNETIHREKLQIIKQIHKGKGKMSGGRVAFVKKSSLVK